MKSLFYLLFSFLFLFEMGNATEGTSDEYPSKEVTISESELRIYRLKFAVFMDQLTDPYQSASSFEFVDFMSGPPHFHLEKNYDFYSHLLTKSRLKRTITGLNEMIKGLGGRPEKFKLSTISLMKLNSLLQILNTTTRYRTDLWSLDHNIQLTQVLGNLLWVAEQYKPVPEEYWMLIDSVVKLFSSIPSGFTRGVQNQLKNIAQEYESRRKINAAHYVLRIFVLQNQRDEKALSNHSFKPFMNLYKLTPSTSELKGLQYRSSKYSGRTYFTDSNYYPLANYKTSRVIFFEELSLLKEAEEVLQKREREAPWSCDSILDDF